MNQRRSSRGTTPLALLALVSLSITACASSGAEENGQGEANGQGDTSAQLAVALDAEPDCLDPSRTSASASFQVTNLIYETLVNYEDGEYVGALAEDYSMSDDGLTYTFTLRQGVSFHDGTPFNAETMAWNIERVLDPETQSRQSGGLLGPVESVEVTGDYTAEVKLSEPYAPFISGVSNASLGMVSPEAVEASSDPWVCDEPVGTGMFQLDSWAKGSDVQLSRFEGYSPVNEDDVGNVGSVDLQLIPEEEVRLGVLQSGEVQIATGVPANRAEGLQGDGDIELVEGEPQGTPYMLLPNIKQAPWDDPNAREALQVGVDWATIVDQLYAGAQSPATSVLTPSTRGFKEADPSLLAHDQDKANELLDSLGYEERDSDNYRVKDGERLTFEWIINSTNKDLRQEIIVAAAAEAKELGIELTQQNLATPALLAALQTEPNGEYSGYGVAYSGFDPDILRSMFDPEQISTSEQLGKNHGRVENENLADILSQTEDTVSDADRASLFEEAQQIILDEHYAIPIYNSKTIYGYDSMTVEGVSMDDGYLLDLTQTTVVS